MKNKKWFIGLVRLRRGLVPAMPEVYKPILPRKIIKPFLQKK
jgi:hypothetical protein